MAPFAPPARGGRWGWVGGGVAPRRALALRAPPRRRHQPQRPPFLSLRGLFVGWRPDQRELLRHPQTPSTTHVGGCAPRVPSPWFLRAARSWLGLRPALYLAAALRLKFVCCRGLAHSLPKSRRSKAVSASTWRLLLLGGACSAPPSSSAPAGALLGAQRKK